MLDWEAGGSEDGPLDLVIRTDVPEVRYLAREIIAFAPEMAGLRFHNWRQPKHQGTEKFRISLYGEGGQRDYKGEDFSFSVATEPHSPALAVTIACPMYCDPQTEQDRMASLLVLDGSLGEKLVQDSIGSLSGRAQPPAELRSTALRSTILRLHEDARKRFCPPTSQVVLINLVLEGAPYGAVIDLGLNWLLSVAYPWRIDLTLVEHEPYKDDPRSQDELRKLFGLKDQLLSLLESRSHALWWGLMAQERKRTISFYAEDVVGHTAALTEWLHRAGLSGKVSIHYDSHWWEFLRHHPACKSHAA